MKKANKAFNIVEKNFDQWEIDFKSLFYFLGYVYPPKKNHIHVIITTTIFIEVFNAALCLKV